MTVQQPVAKPSPYWGEMLDCDGHLYMEPEVMAEIVGEKSGGFVLEFIRKFSGSEEDRRNRLRNRSEVFAVKGLSALGACDPAERLEAMDLMGIKAQILFANTSTSELRIDSDEAREACRRYNDYCIHWSSQTKGRARAIGQINMHSVEWATNELRRVLRAGMKGVSLSSATPPGGVSPANKVWDPFWRMLEEADAPAYLHLGSGGIMSTTPDDPMMVPRGFAEADDLKAQTFINRPGGEEAIGPFYFLNAHLSIEVWLQGMVMGRVFERFPRLRFGVIECGASWTGPMCDRMDHFSEIMAKVGIKYSMKPSEFVRRNVRVTPFIHEDLTKIVNTYGLPEVYVYNTDYPHLEGGRDPIGKFRRHTDVLGDGFARGFFCDNAKLLFPDL